MPPLPPRYLNTVVMLAERRNGTWHYRATGFYYRYFTGGAEGRNLFFLVTSARAIRGNLDNTRVICRRRRGPRTVTYAADGTDGLALGGWLADPKLDVAVLPVDPERLAADGVRCETFEAWGGVLEPGEMGRRRVGEGDDVLLLGFTPERFRFAPVAMVRRGIIARIQDCYRGQSPTFLVEATIFAGNTGGPVVIWPERGRHGQPLTHPKIHLIGVVSESLPNPNEPVRLTQDGRSLDVRVHTGLVQVAPVDALRALRQRGEEEGRW